MQRRVLHDRADSYCLPKEGERVESPLGVMFHEETCCGYDSPSSSGELHKCKHSYRTHAGFSNVTGRDKQIPNGLILRSFKIAPDLLSAWRGSSLYEPFDQTCECGEARIIGMC